MGSASLLSPVVIDLPGWRDPASLLGAARLRGRTALLHSSFRDPGIGRFSLLATDPYMTVSWRGGEASVEGPDGAERHACADPFTLLASLNARHACSPAPPWPFAGGAIGFFSYEAGRALERLPSLAADDRPFPWMDFAFYSWAIAWDHVERRWAVVSSGAPHSGGAVRSARRGAEAAAEWATGRGTAPPVPGRAGAHVVGRGGSSLEREAYLEAVRRIRGLIEEGECYEVNLTRRISYPGSADPVALFRALAASNPAPFAAYVEGSRGILAGSSPERLLHVRGRRAESRPIKGTSARCGDPSLDAAAAEALRASEKNRAENVMIVDLTRNDLGRVCEPGTIAVDALCRLESYEGLHHLVSSVSGRLEEGRGAMDAARALFPPGSMTGAPKVRVMEIIEEIEPVRRGPYAGAAGYLSADGGADLSVVIRSFVLSKGCVDLQVGGAVVADSDPETEYEETRVKAERAMCALSEAWRPPGTFLPKRRRSRDLPA